MNTKLYTPHILLLDKHSVFTDRLTSSVNETWSNRLNMTWSESLSTVSEDVLDKVDVCLFSHRQANALQDHLWSSHTRFFLLCDRTDDNRVSRYLPLDTFIAHVTDGLQLSPPKTEHRGQIDLLLAFDRKERDGVICKALHRAVQNGKTAYFLPLMPTYLITAASLTDKGESLSDLLLLLETGVQVEDKNLGHIFTWHRDGYFQPRLPERSDDLITADIKALEGLLSLLRNRIDHHGHDGYALVACDCLPLETVSRLAVYCNRVFIESMTGREPVSPWFNDGIDRFCTSLPSSCEIRLLEDV